MAKFLWYIKVIDFDRNTATVTIKINRIYILFIKIKFVFSYCLKVVLNKIRGFARLKKVKI